MLCCYVMLSYVKVVKDVDCETVLTVSKKLFKTLAAGRKLSIIVTSMPVCVYFPLMYISGTACPDFAKLSVSVTYGCGSVLLRRRCDMLCTSGFVDDAMFAHSSQERAT